MDRRQASANYLPHLPLITLSCAAAASIISLVPALASWAEYSRSAVAAGQWWRLATCHFTHWSPEHLFWDCASFSGLGILCECCLFDSRRTPATCRLSWRRGTWVIIAGIAVSICLVAAGVHFFAPGIETYRGLSGTCVALFALVDGIYILRASTQQDTMTLGAALTCAGALGAKLAFEASTQQTLFDSTAGRLYVLVPIAHIAGAAAGIIVLWLACGKRGLERQNISLAK